MDPKQQDEAAQPHQPGQMVTPDGESSPSSVTPNEDSNIAPATKSEPTIASGADNTANQKVADQPSTTSDTSQGNDLNKAAEDSSAPEKPNKTESTTVESASKAKKSSTKWILGSIVALVVVALLSLGAYAFLEYNKPENRMKRAIGEIVTSESGEYGVDISFAQGTEDSAVSANIEVGGTFAYDKDGSKGLIEMALPLGMGSPKVNYASTNGPMQLFINVEGVSGTSLSQFIGGSSEIEEFIDKYEGEWIRIDEEDIPDVEFDTEDTDFSVSEEDQEKLLNIIKDSKAVVIKEELESKEINGANADGFVIELDPEGVAQTTRDIGEADLDIVRRLSEEPQINVDFDKLAEQQKTAVEEFNNEEDVRLELWLDGSSLKQVVVEDVGDAEVNGTVTLTVDSLNEDVNVEAPAESVEFNEVREDYEALMEAQQKRLEQQYDFDAGGSTQFDFESSTNLQ